MSNFDLPSMAYKGEVIVFAEGSEEWVWRDIRNVSLKQVKAAIDRAHKEIFKDTAALLFSAFGNSFSVVAVTSQTEDGSFWVRNSAGARSKERHLLADSDDNRRILGEITELESQRAKLREQIQDLQKRLGPFVRPDAAV